MSAIPCYQVDAFTDRPFRGNPAAVCPLEAFLPSAAMQEIAAENNLSETAFFVRRSDGAFDLRWFTPTQEVDLCGHATLASAFVLMTELEPSRARVRFHSASGPLDVTKAGERFVLDFPTREAAPLDDPAQLRALTEALGTLPLELWRARKELAILGGAPAVRELRPDMTKLAPLVPHGLIVSAPGGGVDGDVDFVSRYFTPAEGIDEDPVTGSAHCTLAPYWSARLGKTSMRARQVSRRGGELEVTLAGERTLIAGRAVLVKRGALLLPY